MRYCTRSCGASAPMENQSQAIKMDPCCHSGTHKPSQAPSWLHKKRVYTCAWSCSSQLMAARCVTAWAEYISRPWELANLNSQISAGFVWQQGSSERSIKRCTAITARLHTCMQSGTAASGHTSRLLKSGASSSSVC